MGFGLWLYGGGCCVFVVGGCGFVMGIWLDLVEVFFKLCFGLRRMR